MVAEPVIQSDIHGVAIEEIGPEKAQELLGANNHNRHLRKTVITRLARAMANGEWQLNGETIKVAESGSLIDGQHRLAAVVESQKSVTFLVVRGLPETTQETIDIGEKRTLSDALALRGEKDTNVLAAALRNAWLIKTNGHLFSGIGYDYPTHQELLTFLEEWPSIRASVPVGNRANGAEIRYPASLATALHFLMTDVDEDDAGDFWDKLVTGAGVESGNAILTLRQFLIRDLAAQRRLDIVRRAAVTIKSWNYYRAGRHMLQVRWSRGGKLPEQFPVLE